MTDDKLLSICNSFVKRWKCGLWASDEELTNECFVRCKQKGVATEDDVRRCCASAITMWRYHELKRASPQPLLQDVTLRRWPEHTSVEEFNDLFHALRAYHLFDMDQMFDHRAKMSGYGLRVFEFKYMYGLTNEQVGILIGKSESAVSRKSRELVSFVKDFLFKE